tara:strand:+ start:298 stop:1188 length:891 start_codon:yes stop_codon:yes gene_type:complete
MQLFNNTNFNFTNKTVIAAIFSIIFILSGIMSLIYKGGPSLSIDFTGGNIVQLKFEDNVDISSIRLSIIDSGLPNPEIIEFGSPSEILIKTQYNGSGSQLIQILKDSISTPFNVERYEAIGAKIGSELASDALNAIIVALLLITIYISFRFDRFYAYGSLMAIIHDILITLGIFSILNIDIDLSIIAAFLTIVGYSLNDTIVIFDRIRENRIKFQKEDIDSIVNKSLNASLGRTVITSLTTLIVVIILFLTGGAVIKNFSFALIVGVLVGTYSSIFVASPVMKYFELKNNIIADNE